MTNLARLPDVANLISLALSEDLGRGDATTYALFAGDDGGHVVGRIVARQDLVVSGLEVAQEVFARVDGRVSAAHRAANGDRVAAGACLMKLTGPAAPMLSAERTALNFLQRLSGIATQARVFAEAVAGTGARVVDTRKTTPGWRVLEKAAVRHGGCHNHRADLGSGILIKDNHIAACGGVAAAIERARLHAPHSLRVEVEVDTLDQLDEAIRARADVVLLDNMSTDDVKTGAAKARGAHVLVEVSGGLTLERVRTLARVGVDYLSVGALTHSAVAVDIALDFES